MLISVFRVSLISLALLLGLSAARANERAVYEATAYVQSGLRNAGFFEGDVDGMCSPEMIGAMRRYYGHVGRAEDELPLKCDLMVILYLSAFQHEFGPAPARQLGFDLFTKEEISFANGKCIFKEGFSEKSRTPSSQPPSTILFGCKAGSRRGRTPSTSWKNRRSWRSPA